MEWTEVKIITTTVGIDVLTGLFLDLGINGFVVEDKQDFNEFLEGTELYWDYVDENLMHLKDQEDTIITIYLPKTLQGGEILNQLKAALTRLKEENPLLGPLTIGLMGIKEEDWENNWKQYFKPFPVGKRFVIKPSWETFAEKTERMILEIDPASSFGTGTHDTTQLCIGRLEKHIKQGDKLLDMGCGSGILAIAASMLGANDISIVDIDQNAVNIATENGAKNGLVFQTHCGNAMADGAVYESIGSGYDIIVANIVADVIIGMRPLFLDKLKDTGILITSGIIDSRSSEVYDALCAVGFDVITTKKQGDWVCYVAKKHKK